MVEKITIFWFRRDLRLHDNAGLYHALKSGRPVVPLFIFDTDILATLEDKDDPRVTFIRRELAGMNEELAKFGASLLVKTGSPAEVWKQLTESFDVGAVFTNEDYEPDARRRDDRVAALLRERGVEFTAIKDHVVFSKNEVLKDDGSPYTVFTPYKRRWLDVLKPGFHLRSYPTEHYAGNFFKHRFLAIPALNTLGFTESEQRFPDKTYRWVIADYAMTRDLPGIHGTSHIGIHLRFGTVSIRDLARDAHAAKERTWLNELIWRDFYAMIAWHFPHAMEYSFKREYDDIRWRNNEQEFEAWCEGRTGYPLVDAGMRELNATGWMHNRVRMVTASFLSKHLLVDWRWGERYFARKLLDYDRSSNVGGWQWAAGSGNDAAPYFRVFNPELQQKRFDPKLEYIRKWVPEFDDPFTYPEPIVPHKEARERALNVYREAVSR